MARVTVEDCLDNVDNRFQLVLVASKRARRMARGLDEALVPLENDKPTVVALREIADGLVDPSILDEQDEPATEELSFLDDDAPRVEDSAKEPAEAASEPSAESANSEGQSEQTPPAESDEQQ